MFILQKIENWFITRIVENRLPDTNFVYTTQTTFEQRIQLAQKFQKEDYVIIICEPSQIDIQQMPNLKNLIIKLKLKKNSTLQTIVDLIKQHPTVKQSLGNVQIFFIKNQNTFKQVDMTQIINNIVAEYNCEDEILYIKFLSFLQY